VTFMKRRINKNEYCQGELGKVRGFEMARAGGERSETDRVRQEANVQKIDWLAAAIAHMDGISVAAKKLKVSRGTIYHWLDEGLARASLETVMAISRHGNTAIEYLIRRMGPFKPNGATASIDGTQRRIRDRQR
jgi:DNA-binding phage protein